MSCECEWKSDHCRKVTKILNLLSGFFLITLGVLRYVFSSQLKNFQDFLLSIYCILFGGIVVLTELNVRFVKTQFSFQKEYLGRGLFLIFMIGIINFTCGVTVCTCGLISFTFGFYNKKQNIQEENTNVDVAKSARDLSDQV